MVELEHALELGLFGPVGDEAVAGSEETARTRALLDEERGRARLEEIVRCRVEVVHLLAGEVALGFGLTSGH